MKIDFLFWRGCPSHPEARALLGDVLAARGLDVEVEEHEVTTNEEAQRLSFPGSPTIRVDGRDIDPAAVHYHLAYLWAPAPTTMLRAVRKLEPGFAQA